MRYVRYMGRYVMRPSLSVFPVHGKYPGPDMRVIHPAHAYIEQIKDGLCPFSDISLFGSAKVSKEMPALLFGMQASDYLKSGVSASVYAFHLS